MQCRLAAFVCVIVVELSSARPLRRAQRLSQTPAVVALQAREPPGTVDGRLWKSSDAAEDRLDGLTVDDAPVELGGTVALWKGDEHKVSTKNAKQIGTSCQCVCGDRVIWRRMLFQGDVVKQKEFECEYDICPNAAVPGLKVHAKCDIIQDITTLSAGTVCYCQCGERRVWRNAAFRGDVEARMEHRCLEEICPRVQPIPGYKFESECRYDEYLFVNRDVGSMYGPRPVQERPVEQQPHSGAPALPASAIVIAALLVGLGAGAGQ